MSIFVVLEETSGRVKRVSWEALAAAPRLGPAQSTTAVGGAETELLAAEAAAKPVGRVVRVEHPLLAQYTADGFSDGNLLFEYQVRPPDSYPWVVFQVKMTAGSGNLQLARRTVAWSTNDDCTPASVKRTYQLDRLGEALANSFLQDTVTAEHYIAIRRD